ncbi:hypothetical protein WL80_10680 [Burkholderia ubonensis]|uniref:hypothetical protein n=3 Tax=Burkholderia ubonensis TaxID=101571 RepID=UPI00075A9829|nr:hypothetical protein [Burkholderia ubonensis]KVM65082.1 hypothetical protein WJ60_01960 [Burkholderia ubonensis]KVX82828.1 hypothetical protein WL08_09190 [Burkholderia ubonensis]KVZ03869.1 hypothetical protein WL11_15150 [Burkholderia ubonensis]KWE93343.1 hypothetical protein WL80_10680 [Burkholderia ubonensis]
MERTLADYPAYVPLVKYIYDEMMEGRFDRLVTDGFASPGSAGEFEAALRACLGRESMSAIPEGALLGGDVFLFGDQALCALRIEIPLYASGTRSDAYAIMRVRPDGAGGPGLYLYDILVPCDRDAKATKPCGTKFCPVVYQYVKPRRVGRSVRVGVTPSCP